MDAHRDCDKCCGKVTLWKRGDEVFRVTARKDEWGEVQSYDGNQDGSAMTCRFDKKKLSDWVIEGPTNDEQAFCDFGQDHYVGVTKAEGNNCRSNGWTKAKIADGYS